MLRKWIGLLLVGMVKAEGSCVCPPSGAQTAPPAYLLVIFLVSVGGVPVRYGDLGDLYRIPAEVEPFRCLWDPGRGSSLRYSRSFAYVLSWMTVILSVLILYWLQKAPVRGGRRAGGSLSVLLLHQRTEVRVFVSLFYCCSATCCTGNGCTAGAPGCCHWESWAAGAGGRGPVSHPMSLFVRRLMYVPVQLSEVYAQFFREHPLNLFGTGFWEAVL